MSVAFKRLLAAAAAFSTLGDAAAFANPCKVFSFSAPRQVEPGLKLASPPLLGDFDGNGKPDLLVQTADGTFFLPGNGETFGSPRPVAVRRDGILTAVGDFNGDGRLDAVVQVRAPRPPGAYISLSILLGDGQGGFTQTPDIATPLLSGLALADFDGDGRLDIAAYGQAPTGGATGVRAPAVWILEGDGRGGFSVGPQAVTGLSGSPASIVAADFDRDGSPDLVVSTDGFHCGTVSLFRGNGRGGFGPGEGAGGPGPLLFPTDLNGDGLADLVTGCTYEGFQVATGLAMGDGTFSAAPASPAVSGRWYAGTSHLAADFDGDGNADILVSGPAATGILRGDGRGGLGPYQALFASGTAWHAVDVNGDGRPDLVSVGADGVLNVRTNDCADGGSVETTFLLPVLLSADGASGAVFSSDLTLVNRGRATAVVEARYAPFLGPDAAPSVLPLPAGEQRICSGDSPGCVHAERSVPRPWGGTLRLTFSNLASADEVFALGRIRSAAGSGELGGVAFPAIPESSVLTGPSTIGWLRETSEDRSNLGLVNAGGDTAGAIVLRVTAVSTDPLHPGTAALPDVSLAPGGFFQFDRVLAASGLGAATGFARVERVSGSAPYYAWGVVNDNANADGSIVPPLAAGARAGLARLVLPVVVEAGPFTSELVATNASSVTKVVRLEWVADGNSLPDRTAPIQITLAPGEQLVAPSFAQWLRDRGVRGVGPAGPALAGALFATVDRGDADGLFLGARIAAPGGGGRHGVLVPASSAADLADGAVWLYGLRQDAGNRTNVALVNAGPADGGPDSFLVEIFDGATGLLAAAIEDVRVEARGWRQLGMLLDESAAGVENAYARVTRTSGSAPFLAYAVVNDGGRQGTGTGDGTFLPMRAASSR